MSPETPTLSTAGGRGALLPEPGTHSPPSLASQTPRLPHPHPSLPFRNLGAAFRLLEFGGELSPNPERLRRPGCECYLCSADRRGVGFLYSHTVVQTDFLTLCPPHLATESMRPPVQLPLHTQCLSRDPPVVGAPLVCSHGCAESVCQCYLRSRIQHWTPPLASVVLAQILTSWTNRSIRYLLYIFHLSLPAGMAPLDRKSVLPARPVQPRATPVSRFTHRRESSEPSEPS